jgi:uncharacterized protein YecE (DUF72 family)
MEFGYVPPEKLDKVNFHLPADPAFNLPVLSLNQSAVSPAIYVGCGKWGRKDWIGKIFPEGTKEKDFLQHYISSFNSIELNATFFRVYGPETISGWAEKAAGTDFKFCPKASRALTNTKDFTSPFLEKVTTDFFRGIRAFKENLGPVFFTFEEYFSPSRKENFYQFLETLPADVQLFVELRHPEWFSDEGTKMELFEKLRKLKIGAVVTDVAGRRDCCHMHLTVSKAFIRFTGNHLHPTDFTRLDEWVQRVKLWSEKGLQELYFFMHHPEEKESPELCDYFITELNKHCGTGLQRPKFVERVQG